MDFSIGLLWCHNKYDSTWVIVDRMTKSAHFLPMRNNYFWEDYAKLFIEEMMKLGHLFLSCHIAVLSSNHTFSGRFRVVWGLK